ncbi:hypothetical protein AB7M35_000794 [Amorphus suaedae]
MGSKKRAASATDVANYVGSITCELRDMSLDADLTFLSYLLGMAHLVANEHPERAPEAKATTQVQ